MSEFEKSEKMEKEKIGEETALVSPVGCRTGKNDVPQNVGCLHCSCWRRWVCWAAALKARAMRTLTRRTTRP